MPNFIKVGTHCNFENKSQFSNIIITINKLDLWVPNFIALGIYFILGTKFSWNEGIDTCFNVEYLLLERYFDFWWLLLVTARYCSFPLLVWTVPEPLLIKLQAEAEVCNSIKKEALAQVLSIEFCEIFDNIFSTETLWDDCFWTNVWWTRIWTYLKHMYAAKRMPWNIKFWNL